MNPIRRLRSQRVAYRQQRGQALVFITATAIVVILSMLLMFNVGQVNYHKIKLQNTADAAAYSAAVMQARDLNFSAYMNRGMVANQVAVAQMVSLTGWVRHLDHRYNQSEFNSITDTLANMSTLSFLWTTPFNVGKSVSSGIKSAIDAAAGPVTTGLDILIDVLQIASEGFHYATIGTLTLDTIPNVIKENEPEAQQTLIGAAATGVASLQHLAFVTKYNPAQDKDGDVRFGKVTQASMDLFYKNRSLPLPIWPIPILIDPIRLFTPGAGPLFMTTFHSGGSTMKYDVNNPSKHLQGYTSLDASSTFVIFCITISILGIPIPIPFPLPPIPAGRGAALAGNSGWNDSQGLLPLTATAGNNLEHRNSSNSGIDPAAAVQYGAAHFNPMTAIPAWWKVAEGPGNSLDTRAGIRNYMDIKGNANNNQSNQASTAPNDPNNHKNDRAPAFVIEIERSLDSMRTTTTGGDVRIGGGSDGQLDLDANSASSSSCTGSAVPGSAGATGRCIKSLSKAQAYFLRPKSLFARTDNKTEWGSLYSPYWQAQLLPNDITEQAASIALGVLL